MKQGRATRDGSAGTKVEPKPRAVNPAAVEQLGTMLGNHVEGRGTLPGASVPLYEGRGLKAPMAGQTNHPSGSQRRTK